MKVAVVYHFFPHYRAGVLRELLQSPEHEYWLVADNQSTDPSVKAWPVENPARFILAPCRKLLRALLLQRGLLRIGWRRDLDAIVYLGNPYFVSTWLSAALARLTGKRVLFWTHGWTRAETGLKAALRNLFYKLAHGLLLYGHRAKAAGLAKGFDSRQLHVVYNSLDYEAQKQARDRVDPASLPQLKQELFGDAATPMIVCSARLTAACRLDLLLDAMASLKAELHPVNLLLIGDGPERGNLETHAKRLNVAVHFFGACYDENTLARLTMAAHATVSPGKVGLTALQSLAFGTPVITHDDLDAQGPEWEAILPGTTGDFFRREDVGALSRMIKAWTRTPEVGAETRLACHRQLDRHYNPAFQRLAIDRAVSGISADESIQEPDAAIRGAHLVTAVPWNTSSPALRAPSPPADGGEGWGEEARPSDSRMRPTRAGAPTCVMDYRLAPFSWARLQAAAELGPVLGLEMSAETSEYAWDKVNEPGRFVRVTLFPKGESRAAPSGEMRRCLRAALDRHQPNSVAIVGWSFDWSLTALAWCLENRVPAILLSDSTAISNPRHWWKEAVKRRLVKLFSAGLVAGTPQRDYLAELGMPRPRIFHGWDVVDNDFYNTHSARARNDAAALRDQLGLPEKYFVTVNRFIDVKNIGRLLEAYAGYRNAAGAAAWKLVLVGDGPLKPKIVEWRRRLGLDDHVLLPGFKQYAELPAYYALAGAFVLASTSETWGLVVNEAMACGLPVLVSRRCGCATDLVTDGRNGFTFDPLDIQELTRLLLRIAAPGTDLAAMSRASREIIAQWTPSLWAHNLQLASQAARSAPRPKFGRMDRLLLRLLIAR